MDIKWQALGLTAIILISISLTRVERRNYDSVAAEEGGSRVAARDASVSLDSMSQGLASLRESYEVRRAPARNWEILDPEISARSVLIQSLDDSYPFFHRETYALWPAASLTKLLTAIVVLEEIGANKKITITERAVATEGLSGDLRDGEIYSAQDLLKIMLLSSSNDAATAFEDYLGGRDEFIRHMNRKARELQMTSSVFYDASGLSDLDVTTASDMLRLMKYILLNHPEIFQWTRIPSFLVQPTNDIGSRLVYNINSFSGEENFLGGKTGTSPRARENFVSVFSLGNYRLAFIILGSENRAAETKRLLEWIGKAYNF
ncbi:MAG: serine hydrolase [Nanoarchaeota archaeon]|nr:serine hydrolase [Nanoarchaeota archaeon]